ncbi:transcription factor ATOH8-like [Mercenaria mercenaria]|uniref:transcription factor ATOH8-like n=1 Tax=Mercenaria mercenaria TaxID=6596 RepID=UPI00234F4788|nr:transcription factor ATOH8-like [Mercenaria mercenaria]
MALELTMRHGTVGSLVVPDIKPRFQRQDSDTPLSPSDTPRKNKRKLSEPKRRTTDFSIKRLCPDSPGSACSESGRSEESTPERLHEDSRDSGDCLSPDGLPAERDIVPPHFRPPFVFPDVRHHPYFIPQFYYNRFPGFPASGPLPTGFPAGMTGLPTVPTLSVPNVPAQHKSQSSQDISTKHSPPSPSQPVHVQNKKQSHCKSRASSPKPNREEEDDDISSPDSPKDSKRNRKNYKNMTRERRVEANARERSRVHTISAAFDGLRRAVPSYSYNQKLSKLAILRIACSYINALTKLADTDDGSPQLQSTSFAECVDNCTRTIQTEGKARRRH